MTSAIEGRPLEVLSRPLEELDPDCEVLVVGSGYGGSIAASRLARAGRALTLLERGRELHPGEYPRSARSALAQVQCATGDEHLGDPRALYNFHANGEINVLSGCGLGGTSLINANVSLRPDAAVLSDRRWPQALRDDPQGLETAFLHAEEILQPTTYPASFPSLGKIEALRSVAAAGSFPFRLTPINVSFRTGANAVGVHQEACNGCGDCVTGCNVGAKNTLLMNYLPDAVAHGAKIFTEIEVRSVARQGGRWVVSAQPLGLGRDGFGAAPLSLTADVVVLSAGTLGSTGILLRSAAAGLDLSPRLGECFSGNGDILAFALRPASDVNGVGYGPHAPDPKSPAGPCITSVIEDPGSGSDSAVIIEDAVIPGALARLVPIQLAPQTIRALAGGRPGGGPLAMLESMVSDGRRGELDHLQTFLVMGCDDSGGRIVLDGDQVRISWPGAGESAFYERTNRLLSSLAADAGGTFLHSPIWTKLLGNDLITVHPLGGCVMADGADAGVVDDRGRVYAGGSGTAVHQGLYVWDGSIVPRPVGVNPLLTISALAERGAALLAAERGWEIDYDLGAGLDRSATPPAAPASKPGLRFTERMSGFWSPASSPAADLDDYRQAAAAGKAASRPMTFVLTLASQDIRAVIASLATTMSAAGTLEIPEISPDPLTVDTGSFELLVPAGTADRSLRHMRYHLPLRSTGGERYHLEGHKVVRLGTVVDVWPDTSTLYVTLRAGGPEGEVLGLGVLRIRLDDFARQVRTMRVTGPVSAQERLELLASFGRAFAGPLVSEYASVLPRSRKLVRRQHPRHLRALSVPEPAVIPCETADGRMLRLTRYEGGSRGPVVLSHGMGANPRLFTIDTIETNLLEYLVGHGFDVWLQEWRGSSLLPTALRPFNGDDVARFDFPAAEDIIRQETGGKGIHWIAHCAASMIASMATLSGTIQPASIVASQVSAHPIGPRLTQFKADMHLASLIRSMGIKAMTTDSFQDESLLARVFDSALRLYPISHEERCDQATCKRLAFIYGVVFHHPALNEATHRRVHEMLGVTDLTMMAHLSLCVAKEGVVASDGSDSYLGHLERMQIPITFLSGAKNQVWLPESTRRTFDLLVHEFGPDNYRRHVVPTHGHGDCLVGAKAADDVYPLILEHLERVGT